MKGLLCTKYQKLFIILALLFVPLFICLKNTNSASAVSLGTSGFDLYYKPNSSASTSWQNNILYNDYITISSSGSIYKYQFFTPSVQAGGNYATIHFETNLVALKFDFPLAVNPWVNLPQQNILVCNSNPSGATIISKNLSWATTPWFNYYDNNTYSTNNTLTFYGDLALSGFTMNTNYSFICAIGSDTYSFYDGSEWSSSYIFYFEQNPMTIEWSNDQSIALNQMMVNQNNTIINQNQQMIEQDQQDREDLQNQADSSSDSADSAGADIANGGQRLLDVITTFYGLFINPPQKDCKVGMGTLFNAYHSGTYADADLCSLSPPPAFSIIATLIMIGATIPFAVSVINTLIKIMEGVLTT